MTDWNKLPRGCLIAVFRWLPFKDKLTCSQVCHHWNKSIFDAFLFRTTRIHLVRWNGSTEQYELLNEEVLSNNKRNYRIVEISWGTDCPLEMMVRIETLLNILPQYALRHLIINATPDSMLAEFFLRNTGLMNRIQELTVRIHSPLKLYPETPKVVKYCNVGAECLGSLTWSELSIGNTSSMQQCFNIDAPKLMFVQVQTLPQWTCFSMLNLNTSRLLKRIELDLPNRIWRNISSMDLTKLDVLHFADKSNYLRSLSLFTPNYFLILFRKLENLRFIQMSHVNDTIFRTVCVSCRSLCSMKICSFEIHYKSLLMLDDLKMLQFVTLYEGTVVGPSSTLMPLGSKRTLALNTEKIRELVSQLKNCKRSPEEVWDVVTGCYLKYSRATLPAKAST